MKKRVFIIFIILLLIVLIFSVIYLIYREKIDSKISLKKEYISVEYGNTYSPNIDELIDLSKYNFINKDNIRIENNIQNENEKDYPAVGEYEINVYYKNKCLKQNIEVIDTIKPELSIKDDIEIPFNTDLNSYNFKDLVSVTDLSQVKECYFDFSNVNPNVSGEYIAKVSVEDIYSNKTEKEFKIIVQENKNEKSIDNLNNEQDEKIAVTYTKEDNKNIKKNDSKIDNSIKKDNNEKSNNSKNNNKNSEGTKESKTDVAECGHNKENSYSTFDEAIAEYKKEEALWDYKWKYENLPDEEYYKNRPKSHEEFRCAFCNRWIIIITK